MSSFSLPDLPYPTNALEPVIDARTMEIHHTKHHAGYVSKLNDAVAGADVPEDPFELCAKIMSVPDAKRTAVRNNAGGHANHSLFWKVMAPKGSGGAPAGQLAAAIDSDLAGFDAFKKAFTDAASTRFGSGWAWLSVGPDGKLFVSSTPNQDNPLMAGLVERVGKPILGLDVWEHAYYLNYQNKRPDYIAAWWNIVNWKQVADNYARAKA